MSQYAKTTTVSVEKSRIEAEAILQRYGADRFAYLKDKDDTQLIFEVNNRQYKLKVTAPDRDSKEMMYTEKGRIRAESNIETVYQQAVRQRWRVLVLLLKAKLESIELGYSTIEDEFLAYSLLRDGRTLGEAVEQMPESLMSKSPVAALLGE